ncbi:helix-turn-helix domain-containing protein [Leifsonia sp. Le1]|uniref:helix-turn-helix domain-containing protein n=1 Tax=Leifsonia sp. Le1 TaxID=3404918 RepID=UPI003EBCB3D7
MYTNEAELRRIIREELERLLGGSLTTNEKAVGSEEIAEYLGVSVFTARVKAQTGVIPAFKVGNQWRYYLSEVRAHLEAPPADPWTQSNRSRTRRRLS